MPVRGWKKPSSIGKPTAASRRQDMAWNGYHWVFTRHPRCKKPQLPAVQVHYEWGRELPSGEIVLLEVKRGVYGHD